MGDAAVVAVAVGDGAALVVSGIDAVLVIGLAAGVGGEALTAVGVRALLVAGRARVLGARHGGRLGLWLWGKGERRRGVRLPECVWVSECVRVCVRAGGRACACVRVGVCGRWKKGGEETTQGKQRVEKCGARREEGEDDTCAV